MNRRTHPLRHVCTVYSRRRRRFRIRAYLKVGLVGGVLVLAYVLAKLVMPGLSGPLDGLFAGLLERVGRGLDEEG